MRPPFPKWSERGADHGNFFNPPFLMYVLTAACHGFEAEQRKASETLEFGMAFSLLFLAAPLALDAEFNKARPNRVTGNLVSWSKKHPTITANMSSATYSLVPAVREAIVYGLRAGYLRAGENGRFIKGDTHGAAEQELGTDLSDHWNNAVFVGRWLAKNGATASILKSFALRP